MLANGVVAIKPNSDKIIKTQSHLPIGYSIMCLSLVSKPKHVHFIFSGKRKKTMTTRIRSIIFVFKR